MGNSEEALAKTSTESKTGGLVQAALDPEAVQKQVQQIQGLMDKVMTEGEHYDNPSWASSPILKKAGAEKISFAFRLNAEFDIEIDNLSERRSDLPPGHREYHATCRIHSRNGEYLGMGKGSCSTAEPKYRYRKSDRLTDFAPPSEFWNSYEDSMANADFSILRDKLMEEGEDFPPDADIGVSKDDETGNWHISIEGRVENPELEAQYNTCLKMAQKRAYVGTVQQVTAASDIFTQDLDDPDLAKQVREEKGAGSQSRSQGSQSTEGQRGANPQAGGRSRQQQQQKRQRKPSGGNAPQEKVTKYGVDLVPGNAKHVDTALESLRSRPGNVSFEAAADQIRDHYGSAPEPLQEAIGYMIADEKPDEPQNGGFENEGQDLEIGEGSTESSDAPHPDDNDAPTVTLPEDLSFREKLVSAGVVNTAEVEQLWDNGALSDSIPGVGPKRAKKIAEELGFTGQSEAEDTGGGDEPGGSADGEAGGDAWEEGDPQDEFEEDPPF